MKRLTHHVFVCLNERPAGHPRGCCMSKGSPDVLQALKEKAAAAGLTGQLRIQKSGCLDVCEQGVSVVVYPEGTWYGGVKPTDAEEIVESHLRNGKRVERLLIEGK